MKIPAKITLSLLEQQLIAEPGWIHAKNEVIRKVVLLLGQLSETYQHHPAIPVLPEAVRKIAPKISKGENYKGLPYVVLDYPRFFQKEDVFAIRSFFWWGHSFSCTLHLKRMYYDIFAEKAFNHIQQKISGQWWINRTGEEWIHDLKEEAHWYLLKRDSVFVKNENKLLKLSTSIPVSKWEEALPFLEGAGSILLDSLKDI